MTPGIPFDALRNGNGTDREIVNVAIIGASGYAGILLRSLLSCLETGRDRLIAATLAGEDARSETARRLSDAGCAIFPHYEGMFEALGENLALCVIPTGIHWHTRMSVSALQHGANVLVEKPLAGNVSDARSIAEMAHATGRFVAVGFQDMYSATTASIKRFLCSGAIGPVRNIDVTGSWPRSLWYYTRNDWAGKKTIDGWAVGDSPVNNAFAHFLNLALYFAGSHPETLAEMKTCTGVLVRHFPIEMFDTVRAVFADGDGLTIRCGFTHFDPTERAPRLVVRCAQGSLIWEFEQRAQAFDARGTPIRSWKLPGAEELRRDMIVNVLGCVRAGRPPRFTADDALTHARAVELMTNLPIVDASEDETGATDFPDPLVAQPM